MKCSLKCVLMIVSITVCLVARSNGDVGQCRVGDMKWHNINEVELQITNFGSIADCIWPKNSNHHYIFGAGIWFGTIDSLTNDTLVTIGYGPHGGETEFAPGLHTQDPMSPSAIIYMYPDPWPAPPDTFPMAPQDIVSQQDSWCCYNDCDSNYHVPGDTRPIGIEVYQTVYAWDKPDVVDMIFVILETKNVSENYLEDCYIGFCADIDIGNEAAPNQNDMNGAIIGKWYVIDGESLWVDDLAFQWQEDPEPGWTEFSGVIGLDLLQTPFDLEAGQDKDGDGIPDQYEQDSSYYANNLPPEMWDVDLDNVPDWRDPSQWPQLGMTAFKRFTLAVEPSTDPDRYMTLAGYNYLTGEYEPYDTMPTQPDDQRFLLSSGPFNLAPDSSATIIFAIMFANWMGIYETPDTALVEVDQVAEDYYNMYWYLYTGVEEFSLEEKRPIRLFVQPNPVRNHARITYSSCASGNVSLKLYDILGRLQRDIFQGYQPAGIYSLNMTTEGMSQGMYFLVFETPERKQSVPLVIIR